MKLIIDIPDHIYSMVTNTGTFGCYRFNTSKAIMQGIPLNKIRTEISNIKESEWVDPHTILARTPDQVKQMALDIIDKYKEGVIRNDS